MQNPNPVGKDSSVNFGARLMVLRERLTKTFLSPQQRTRFPMSETDMGKTPHSENPRGNLVSWNSKAQQQPKQRTRQNKKAV